MRQLTCEMCGSTDLMKQDGVFVCQTCGCKYSVEEARKMMVEGTVDVQGTVKVDNSAFVQKYLANARRAKEKEDWEETEKYYNMVEQNDPDNIEAIFYSAYGKAMTTLVDGDIYKRQAAFKVLANCISVIDDHYKPERKAENQEAITAMAVDLGRMVTSNFVFTEWENGYGIVTKTNKGETYTLFASLLDEFKVSIDNIQKVDDQPYLHQSLITLFAIAKMAGFAPSAITILDKWIKEEETELEALRKVVIEKYWTDHAEEKQQLDSEKESLNNQIKSIKDQMGAISEAAEVVSIEGKMADLKKQKDSLSLFKGKEKKALQEQIEQLDRDLTGVKNRKAEAEKPFLEQIQPLEARIKEIDEEFTKDR